MAIDPREDTVKVMENILKEYGLEIVKGKNLKPAKINNGGFPCDYSPYDYFRQCLHKTGCY